MSIKQPSHREFFNGLAEDWDEMTHHDPQKLTQIVDLLEIEEDDMVLDVGCGTGVMIPYLLERLGEGGRVIAVDFSEKMVSIARDKFPKSRYLHVEFIAEDVLSLEMKGEYDAILCYSCFPHFQNQQETVKHLAGGLCEGGRLIVAHSESRDAINSMHKGSNSVVHSDYLPPSTEISEMMREAKVEIKEIIDNEEIFVIVGVKRERSD
jgi:demethylmenaquinone methyltransferase/2-methoxy-6-polyprenyl-1,4-benzoquinol methylase